MSKSLSLNRTDTAVSGVTSLTLPRAVLNFGADFVVKSDEPEEAILTNITSPIDAPEKLRIAVTEIKDVYRNSGIDPTMYSASRRGINLLVQLTGTYTISESTDLSFRQMLPFEIHVVVKVPAHELVTEAVVLTQLGRVVSGFFETGSDTSVRLKSMLRGSLIPADL